MIDHIKELLKTHDCVVVPGLGGLIGHYEPARRHMTSGTMSPPMKRVAFNSVLRQNDGVLIHYLSRHKGISYDRAREEVETFVKKVEQALEEHGAYLFAGIGKLTYDESRKLQFHPILKENLLLETYSLPLVVAQPIRRIEEDHAAQTATAGTEAMAEIDNTQTIQTYPSWLFRAAAVVGMAFILTTAGQSIFSGGFDGDQLSFLPSKAKPAVLEALPSVPKWTGSSDFKLYEMPVIELEEPETVQPADLPSSATFDGSEDTYYIIVGSFLDDARLQRELNAMTGAGFSVRTLPGPNGYTRVGLEFDARSFPRMPKLEEIRSSVNKDAWLING